LRHPHRHNSHLPSGSHDAADVSHPNAQHRGPRKEHTASTPSEIQSTDSTHALRSLVDYFEDLEARDITTVTQAPAIQPATSHTSVSTPGSIQAAHSEKHPSEALSSGKTESNELRPKHKGQHKLKDSQEQRVTTSSHGANTRLEDEKKETDRPRRKHDRLTAGSAVNLKAHSKGSSDSRLAHHSESADVLKGKTVSTGDTLKSREFDDLVELIARELDLYDDLD